MDKEKIQEGVRLILEGIGEDIHREGLVETPDRIARMYEELAAGYTDDAAVHLKTWSWKKTFIFILFVNTICCLFTEQRQLPTFLTGKWWA